MNLIDELKSLLIKTNYDIYGHEQINLLDPQLLNYVDLIFETDKYFIYFKDFWTWNNINSQILNEYLCVLNKINFNSIKKHILFLITKQNNFNFSNIFLNQKNIYIIQEKSKLKLIKEISELLYSNGIYFYEQDDSVIMLE